jgi:hypothetical protein
MIKLSSLGKIFALMHMSGKNTTMSILETKTLQCLCCYNLSNDVFQLSGCFFDIPSGLAEATKKKCMGSKSRHPSEFLW